MSSDYPLGSYGQWHSGIHLSARQPITVQYPGKLVAYRLSNDIKYPQKAPQTIDNEDKEKISGELKNKYQWEPNGAGGLQTPVLNQEDIAVLCKQIGLAISGDFFLLEHTIKSANDKTLTFFTLYMHCKPLGQFEIHNPEKNNWKRISRVDDLLFGIHKPFYINYRFKYSVNAADTDGRSDYIEATRLDTKQGVRLPVKLVVSTSLDKIQQFYSGRRILDHRPNQILCSVHPAYYLNRNKENAIETVLPSAVLTLGPRNAERLDQMECTIKNGVQLYIERDGALREVAAATWNDDKNKPKIPADIRPEQIRQQSGIFFAKASGLRASSETSRSLKGAEGYIALNKLASIDSTYYRVTSNSPLFIIARPHSNDPSSTYISDSDQRLAENGMGSLNIQYIGQKSIANQRSMVGSEVWLFPVMYVKTDDIVVKTSPETEMMGRDAQGRDIAGAEYVKVRYSVGNRNDFFVRLDDLSSDSLIYYQIKERPASNRDPAYGYYKSGLPGLAIYDTENKDAVIDIIGDAETEFEIRDMEKFSQDNSGTLLEIIRYRDNEPWSRGFIKKADMARYSFKWNYKYVSPDLPKDEIQYPGNDHITIPYGAVLGQAGQAEEETAVHFECFTRNENTPFDTQGFSGQKYVEITDDTVWYTAAGPEPVKEGGVTLPVHTVFKMVEQDIDKYPRSRKIEIEKYPVSIDLSQTNNEQLSYADFFGNSGAVILPAGLTAVPIKYTVNDEEKTAMAPPAALEPLNTAAGQCLFGQDILAGEKWWIAYDYNFADGQKFELTSSKTGNIYRDIHGIKVKKEVTLPLYKKPPDLILEAKATDGPSNIKIVQKINVSSYAIRRTEDGTEYWEHPESGGNYLKVENNYPRDYWRWSDYFTAFSKDDLSGFSDAINKKEFFKTLLQNKGIPFTDRGNTVVEFLHENRETLKNCSFEHATEWSAKNMEAKEYIAMDYDDEWKDLIGQVEIWKDNRNTNLPEAIRQGESLLYFHPEVYINHFKHYDNGHTENLIKVQDAVLLLRCLKQGNLGIYPENYGSARSAPDQTYCNHAVFLTVLATDQNAKNFTNIQNNTAETTIEVSCGFPEASKFYIFKRSNFWYDRLVEQAGAGKVVEVKAEEAQFYGNMGYTVVAAWKNRGSRESPHYATVRPGYEYSVDYGPMVANVGDSIGVVRGQTAFGRDELSDVRWFYNPTQDFRCYLNLINGYRERLL
jgi:hypothetical protein